MFFSVIIPTYNRKDIVQKSLNSVLVQSFDDYEVIVVDNGSTDGTAEVLQEYASQNPRIRYHWQENSGSPAGSRNTGLKLAKGEWIAFLDSDDLWLPGKLRAVHDALQAQDGKMPVGIAHSAKFTVNGKVVEVRSVRKGMDSRQTCYENLFWKGNFICTSAMCVQAEAIQKVGEFNASPDYAIVEDYDLWLRLASFGEIVYLDEVHTEMIVGEDSMSLANERQQNNLYRVLKDNIDRMSLDDKRRKEYVQWAEARVEYFKGKNYVLAGEKGKGRKHLVRSLSINSKDVRTWVYLLKSLSPF